MNWKIIFNENPNYCRIVCEGDYDYETQVSLMGKVFYHPQWKPGMPVLVDNRTLQYGTNDLSSVLRSSDKLSLYNDMLGNSRIAFLVSTLGDHEITRRFELHTGEMLSAWMHVFLDETAALRWLLADPFSRKFDE